MTDDQMRDRLIRDVDTAGGLRVWAKTHSVNPGQLSRAMAGKVPLPPVIVEALGYERVVSYRKIENGRHV